MPTLRRHRAAWLLAILLAAGALGLAIVLLAPAAPPPVPEAAASVLCEVLARAPEDRAARELRAAARATLGWTPREVLLTPRGAYLVSGRQLVWERGLFLLRPGAVPPGGKGADPTLEPGPACVYAYEISG